MISVAWAQDAAAAAPMGDMNAIMGSLLPFVLVFAVLYFVMLRPQMMEAKKHAAMLADLKKGDVVLTDGGLIGEIVSLKDKLAHVKLAEGVVVTVAREAIKTALDGEVAKNWQPKAVESGKKK